MAMTYPRVLYRSETAQARNCTLDMYVNLFDVFSTGCTNLESIDGTNLNEVVAVVAEFLTSHSNLPSVWRENADMTGFHSILQKKSDHKDYRSNFAVVSKRGTSTSLRCFSDVNETKRSGRGGSKVQNSPRRTSYVRLNVAHVGQISSL